MKTEIVIEDSVARELMKFADGFHITFTDALGLAISAGISDLSKKEVARKEVGPYKMRTHRLGKGLDDPKAMLALLDEEDDLKRYGTSIG